jgi:hypothetical protein
MPGEFHDYTISVLFRAETLLQQHDKKPARHSYIVGPNGIESIINTVNGGTLWRMGFSGFKEPQDLDRFDFARRLFDAVGREFEFTLESQLQWTRATRSAERYASERAFLVGDAAHSWSPTGGFGMNTGLNDAVDLAWKLAATLQGWGGVGLLASYDAERRPVCERIINEARENYRRLTIYDDVANVCDDTPEGAETRRALAEKIQQTNRREYETLGVQMGYHYDNSPICIDDGTPPPPARHDVYAPTSRPGHLAPHAWLDKGRSTLDLFGNGLTLCDFGDDAGGTSPFESAAQDRGIPLTVERIPVPHIREIYERRYVLVRPDGHVAWRGDFVREDAGQILDVARGAA